MFTSRARDVRLESMLVSKVPLGHWQHGVKHCIMSTSRRSRTTHSRLSTSTIGRRAHRQSAGFLPSTLAASMETRHHARRQNATHVHTRLHARTNHALVEAARRGTRNGVKTETSGTASARATTSTTQTNGMSGVGERTTVTTTVTVTVLAVPMTRASRRAGRPTMSENARPGAGPRRRKQAWGVTSPGGRQERG